MKNSDLLLYNVQMAFLEQLIKDKLITKKQHLKIKHILMNKYKFENNA